MAQEGGAHLLELLRTSRTPAILRLEGDIDLAASGQLNEALGEAIAAGVTTIDLSGVTFMDSTGLHAILSAARSLNGQGPLVLERPSRSVARLLGIALPGALPGIVIRAG